eukprot:25650-Lingulodinium_polyedra.AAC.1
MRASPSRENLVGQQRPTLRTKPAKQRLTIARRTGRPARMRGTSLARSARPPRKWFGCNVG